MRTIPTDSEHRLAIEPIQDLDAASLLEGEQSYILNTDPPFEGTMKYWTTRREKATGQASSDNLISYKELLDHLVDIVEHHVDGYVFVAGSAQTDTLERRLEPVLDNVMVHHPLYRSGGTTREYTMVTGGTAPQYAFNRSLDGLGPRSEAVISAKFDQVAEPGRLVLDPFVGEGLTARFAVRHGMRFAGNEFNPSRAQQTARILEVDA